MSTIFDPYQGEFEAMSKGQFVNPRSYLTKIQRGVKGEHFFNLKVKLYKLTKHLNNFNYFFIFHKTFTQNCCEEEKMYAFLK